MRDRVIMMKGQVAPIRVLGRAGMQDGAQRVAAYGLVRTFSIVVIFLDHGWAASLQTPGRFSPCGPYPQA